MKHLIRHVTHYRYTAPVSYSIQVLRLTPRQDDHQRALRWFIDAPAPLQEQVDAFGNITHTLTMTRPHEEIELRVTGHIEIDTLAQGRLPAEDHRLPLQAFCVPTALTQPDAAVRDLSRSALAQGLKTADDALTLAEAICDRVKYEPGTTDVTTAAGEVLRLGHGVCQDHAHLFLACARGLGVPARYVSGYLYTEAAHAASHAWADVWLDGLGWVSVDITNRQFASDCHCRLAVARDYDSASPVRGVRNGGGGEVMSVSVQVQAAYQQ
ncbi:transglutaminase family protein [Bordetella genomosp. 12]|uniref:Transglutaminase n=1 Tax=Bordetella genomosp. 12 TaxID=463035 RepID=A0A261VEB1_9BORD|nr:transglutaminase family protein [Bordetella genomosp. 12]OZI72101.1 transglutaminase [Bordetella genomosp. 12]